MEREGKLPVTLRVFGTEEVEEVVEEEEKATTITTITTTTTTTTTTTVQQADFSAASVVCRLTVARVVMMMWKMTRRSLTGWY